MEISLQNCLHILQVESGHTGDFLVPDKKELYKLA